MNEAQRETILKQQEAGWERAREAGRAGNPMATVCLHCYGRHPPPRDDICPNDPPKPHT
jgi:DNA invertase Pin-like site-specific DNA recombinase